jgi:hypothetical protein
MRAHALLLRGIGALALPGVVAAMFVEAQACNPACTGPEREYTGGKRFTSGVDLVYETSPEDGPFLPFEGATDLHLRHELGFKPYKFNIYLSFNERPTDQGNGGFAPSAGNQTVILSVDEHEMRIRNDTCADYFIRVVAIASPQEASDGGADGEIDAETGAETGAEVAADADAAVTD